MSEGTGRPPRRGRARGLGEPAPPEEHRHLGRIDRVVCGLATRHRRPGEGLAAPTGHPFVGTPSREPVPGKHPRDGHAEARARGGHGMEPRCRCGLHVAVQSDGAIVSYEAAGPAPRVQSKTTGKGVLVGVESP